MKDEKFLELSTKEQEQLKNFFESKRLLNESEASLENQKKWRIIYERAPKETIPFIIYCAEVVSVSLIGLFKVLELTGYQLYIGFAIIICALFFPLLVLPGKSWRELWGWIRKDVAKKQEFAIKELEV